MSFKSCGIYEYLSQLPIGGTNVMIRYDEVANLVISPVTLYYTWPKSGRLLLFFGLIFVGVLNNIAFIVAFFTNYSLGFSHHVFLCLLGVMDLSITGIAMPISLVVLVSGEGDTVDTCRIIQFTVTNSIYCKIALYLLIAYENHLRAYNIEEARHRLPAAKVYLITGMMCAGSLGLSALGTFYGLDYDYCGLSHKGEHCFRIFTNIGLIILPICITLLLFLSAGCRIHRRAQRAHYRRSLQYETDKTHLKLNIITYIIYLGSWIGYFLIVNIIPTVTSNYFYVFSWIGAVNSVYCNFIYNFGSESFRDTFVSNFNYCCRKNTTTNKFTNRHHRAVEHRSNPVRVHMLQPGVGSVSPYRASANERGTQEL